MADIYQSYDIGKFEYKNKEDDKRSVNISGNILEKRKIIIKNQEIVDVIVKGDKNSKEKYEQYIRDKIENSNTNKLGDIIETVQEDQNKIIRESLGTCILVQGCAGSGKSSVAYHRLAYLIYNYKLSEEDVLVITPNKLFMNYTKDLFLELGNDINPMQYTFLEFSKEILQEEFSIFDNKPDIIFEEVNRFKTSKNFKLILDKYIDFLCDEVIPKTDIQLDEFKLIEYNEIKEIWDKQFNGYKINDRIIKFKPYIEKKLKEKLLKHIDKIGNIYETNIENLRKQSKKIKQFETLIKANIQEKELRKQRILTTGQLFIDNYLKGIKKVDVLEAYYELLTNNDILEKISEEILTIGEIENLENSSVNCELNHIDAIAAMYLYSKLQNPKNKYRHIVVDECQDLSFIEVSIIEELSQSFTLVGDFNQRIMINKSNITVDQINNIFGKYTFFKTFYLNKSFRNSKQITEYANKIMEGNFINDKYIPIAFSRDSEKPCLNYCNNDKSVVKNISDKILKYRTKNPEHNIGIILRSESEIKKYKEYLSKKFEDINIIDDEYKVYKKGINLLSARLSKGLEFDYVLIPDIDLYKNTIEDKRVLYIAITRALHKLDIYTLGNNGFIEKIDEKLFDKTKITSNEAIIINLKKTISEAIYERVDTIPIDIFDKLENIDDVQALTEIIRSISYANNIEDLKKIFT